MSSKSKSKHNSPKTSGKSKASVNERKNARQSSIDSSSSGLDFGLSMKAAIREEDIQRIVSVQKRSLRNFAKTNELLGQFNDFSSSKYSVLQHMFVQHTRLLVELKKDLTNVFLRIRRLKVRLQKQYPDAFDATFNLRKDLEDRLEQEVPDEPTYAIKAKETDLYKGKTETKNTPDQNQHLGASSFQGEENGNGNVMKDKSSGLVKEGNCDRETVEGVEQIRISRTSEDECFANGIERTNVAREVDQELLSEKRLESGELKDAELNVYEVESGIAEAVEGRGGINVTEKGVRSSPKNSKQGVMAENDSVTGEDMKDAEDNLENVKTRESLMNTRGSLKEATNYRAIADGKDCEDNPKGLCEAHKPDSVSSGDFEDRLENLGKSGGGSVDTVGVFKEAKTNVNTNEAADKPDKPRHDSVTSEDSEDFEDAEDKLESLETIVDSLVDTNVKVIVDTDKPSDQLVSEDNKPEDNKCKDNVEKGEDGYGSVWEPQEPGYTR